MKIKHFLTTAIIAAAAISTPVMANDIDVMLNQEYISFTEPKPVIIDGRTMLPLRGLFDEMGFEISWDANTKTATLINEDVIIYARSGSLVATDRKTMEDVEIPSDVSPQLVNDYFMLPVRAVAGATGADVAWDANSRTVSITMDINGEPEKKTSEGTTTADEKVYLLKTMDLATSLKELAKENNDPVMLRFWNPSPFGDTTLNATPQDYAKTQTILDDLKDLTPPENMTAIDTELENFITVVEKAYKLSESANKGEISPQQLAIQIDALKSEKNLIAIDHSTKLYAYFTENSVYFEDVYGEQILDILK